MLVTLFHSEWTWKNAQFHATFNSPTENQVDTNYTAQNGSFYKRVFCFVHVLVIFQCGSVEAASIGVLHMGIRDLYLWQDQ